MSGMSPRHLWKLPVDAFARREHYLDHMLPVWNALDEDTRGKFYVPEYMADYAVSLGLEPRVLKPENHNLMRVWPGGMGPLLVAAYNDMLAAIKRVPQRPIIFMEHGVGLSFGDHPGYAGGGGTRVYIDLFLDPNEHVREKNRAAFPKTPGVVIGTPKMTNSKIPESTKNKKPVVCISFHWNGDDIAPEAGNAFKYYMNGLPALAACERFELIGHGHPRYRYVLDGFYREQGIKAIWDFGEVMERADLYINDSSSTLYEFCTTGKPVILLNDPKFRKNKHWGIRFWDYSDIGPQVDDPDDLLATVLGQLDAVANGEDSYQQARKRAVRDLYPYVGQRAARRAARAIEEFSGRCPPRMRKVRTMRKETVGIVYMAFGEPALEGVKSSVNSLSNLGLDIPVCVVGDLPIDGMQFVRWPGESPFDPECARNFQFRAGRIKPGLVELTPFDRTLYIDADTEFMSKRVLQGWRYLDIFDMALAEELLAIGELYNKPRAGWEINIMERDATIEELGGDRKMRFLNSGVIFFRKNDVVRRIFEEWGAAWREWQQWDEQLSLMRAMYRCGKGAKIKTLSADWNHPHRDQAEIIFHNYGRGPVRSNVELAMA